MESGINEEFLKELTSRIRSPSPMSEIEKENFVYGVYRRALNYYDSRKGDERAYFLKCREN
mgnify:CR=1 FL=1